MKIVVMCPKCKKSMNYESRTQILSKKRKRCVYCGHSFLAREHIVKKGWN